MLPLTDKETVEYLLRCYMAVDGLWFLKLEEKYGFDAALEIDKDVWRVMPKIQARVLKSLGKAGNGLEGLFDCFTTKLAVEGTRFQTEKTGNPRGFRIIIERCPWFDSLEKSGRGHITEKIGANICAALFPAWAAQFGDGIKFQFEGQICKGSGRCVLRFSQ